MGCEECGTHGHVPCVPPLNKEEGVLSDPSNTATGRFRVQNIYFGFWKTDSVCAYGSARPDLLLEEVTEKRGTGVEIIYKELVACAKQLCVHKLHHRLVTQPLATISLQLPFVYKSPMCTHYSSLQGQKVYIPSEQAYSSYIV